MYSPRPCHHRIILNAKHLKYTTTWVKVHEIQTILPQHNIPPTGKTADGAPFYTVPAIIDATKDPSNPIIISESAAIIEYLESQYRERPVFPPSSGPALHFLAYRYIMTTIVPVLGPLTRRPILEMHIHDPSAYGFFLERMGAPLEQIEPGPVGSKEREEAWRKVEAEFDALARFIEFDRSDKALTEGEGDTVQYCMGNEPSYADYMMLAVMIFVKNSSPKEGWEKINTWSEGRWARFWNACEGLGLLKVN